MKRRQLFRLALVAAAAMPIHVGALVLMTNDLPPNTTKSLLKVSAGKVFKLNSAVISVAGCATSVGVIYRQRILKSGKPITADLSIGVGHSFQITFDPAITYAAGNVLAVQNADNSGYTCSMNFTIQGTSCSAGATGC